MNNYENFKFNIIKTSLLISAFISFYFFLLRITDILPRDKIIIFILSLAIIFSLIFYYLIQIFPKKFNLYKNLIFIIYISLLIIISFKVKNNLIYIWYFVILIIITITSSKKSYLIYSSIIGIIILYFIFLSITDVHTKILLLSLFLSFFIIGLLINIQFEIYHTHTEAQTALLEKISLVDFLTETYNRRAFFKLSKIMINDAIREKENLSIIMLDIDFFKQINDKYGHQAGDKVLKMFALNIKNNLRKNDIFARIGGEEFIILSKTKEIEDLITIMSKILLSTRELTIKDKNNIIKFTVSLGGYIFNPKNETLEEAMQKADIALYKAKEKRNRIKIHNILDKEITI